LIKTLGMILKEWLIYARKVVLQTRNAEGVAGRRVSVFDFTFAV